MYIYPDNLKAAPTLFLWRLKDLARDRRAYFRVRNVAGNVIPQNIERGIEMLSRSAELGNSAASYALGKIYLFGNGADRDIDMARHWLTLSADAGNEYAKALLENMDRYNMTAAQNAVLSMFLSFGKLISDDYNRSSRGLKLRTEHKLKAAIRCKKQALGLKESPLENPQFRE